MRSVKVPIEQVVVIIKNKSSVRYYKNPHHAGRSKQTNVLLAGIVNRTVDINVEGIGLVYWFYMRRSFNQLE